MRGGRIVLIPRPPSSSLSYDESTFRNSFQLESNPYYVGIVSYVSTFHQARLFAFFLGTADWAPSHLWPLGTIGLAIFSHVHWHWGKSSFSLTSQPDRHQEQHYHCYIPLFLLIRPFLLLFNNGTRCWWWVAVRATITTVRPPKEGDEPSKFHGFQSSSLWASKQ